MLELKGYLISEDIIEKQFVCNLDKCKGVCCMAGDTGAPLDEEEIPIMAGVMDKVIPYLPKNQKIKLRKKVSGKEMMTTSW